MIPELQKIFLSRSNALEVFYMLQDIKSVVRLSFYSEELGPIRRFCEMNKITILTSDFKIKLVEFDEQKNYTNKSILTGDTDPTGMFMVYISKDSKLAENAKSAEKNMDNAELGRILGYPECCIKFFVENTTKAALGNNDFFLITLENSKPGRYPFQNNLGQRHKDVVLLSHFPCKLDCTASKKIGDTRLKIISSESIQIANYYERTLKEHLKDKDILFE